MMLSNHLMTLNVNRKTGSSLFLRQIYPPLLHIRNVISSPFFSSLLSRYFQRNIVLRQIVAILFHFVKRYRQIEENK